MTDVIILDQISVLCLPRILWDDIVKKCCQGWGGFLKKDIKGEWPRREGCL